MEVTLLGVGILVNACAADPRFIGTGKANPKQTAACVGFRKAVARKVEEQISKADIARISGDRHIACNGDKNAIGGFLNG